MTIKDIFFASCIFIFVAGIICLSLSAVCLIAFAQLNPAFAQIQAQLKIQGFSAVVAANNFSSFANSFVLIIPDIAALGGLLLIASSWLASWYLRASPLAVVFGIAMLIGYLIVSFFLAQYAIQIARLEIFANIIPSSNLLMLEFANMPTILLVAAMVDVVIAVTAAKRG